MRGTSSVNDTVVMGLWQGVVEGTSEQHPCRLPGASPPHVSVAVGGDFGPLVKGMSGVTVARGLLEAALPGVASPLGEVSHNGVPPDDKAVVAFGKAAQLAGEGVLVTKRCVSFAPRAREVRGQSIYAQLVRDSTRDERVHNV